MSGAELHDLLERVGDDGGRPLSTDIDALVSRARRSAVRRRRIRQGGAALALAAAVAGVALAPRLIAPTSAPEPTGRIDHLGGPPLPEKEIVSRCLPQLQKYAGLPMYDSHPATAPWHLSHEDRSYRVGDLVQLTEAGGDLGNPVLCVIPSADATDASVPFSALTPTEPGDLLRDVCAEQATGVGDGGVRLPDLRRATIVASDFQGPVGLALLRTDAGRLYGCATSPPDWDAGIPNVGLVVDGGLFEEFGTTGSSNKSIVSGDAAYSMIAGPVPDGVASVTVSRPGSATRTYAVSDGYFAAIYREHTTQGLQPVTWRMLAADGSVVRTGTTD